jgi:hypothetical protein
MKFRSMLPLLVVLTFTAEQAVSAVATCTYKVGNVTADPGGSVNVTLDAPGSGAAWQHVCNLNNTETGITPSACKAIFTTLLTAKTTQRDTLWWFDSPVAFTCTAPAWGNLRGLGWYWGPALL